MRKFKEALQRIQEWCVYWHLNIQADKCVAICFSLSEEPPDFHLRLNGVDIKWTQHIKVFGLILSYNLTFHAHFKHLQWKCIKRLNVLKAFASPCRGVRTLWLIPQSANINGNISCKHQWNFSDVYKIIFNFSPITSGYFQFIHILHIYAFT